MQTSFRNEMLHRITMKIYNSALRHRIERIAVMVKTNSKIHDNNQECFTFRGLVYETFDRQGAYPVPMNMLHASLTDELISYIADGVKLADERTLVKAYIQRVMMTSSHLSDYLKLMPSNTHSIIKAFKEDLAPGNGALNENAVTEFLEQNEKYLILLKNRATLNLLDAP